MAHFANDPVGDARSEKDYRARIANRGNAYLAGLQCGLCKALFAGKRIRAGEEVLAPYTYDYWKMRYPPLTKRKLRQLVLILKTHRCTNKRATCALTCKLARSYCVLLLCVERAPLGQILWSMG